jgi:hypothetical protein
MCTESIVHLIHLDSERFLGDVLVPRHVSMRLFSRTRKALQICGLNRLAGFPCGKRSSQAGVLRVACTSELASGLHRRGEVHAAKHHGLSRLQDWGGSLTGAFICNKGDTKVKSVVLAVLVRLIVHLKQDGQGMVQTSTNTLFTPA